MITSTCGQAVGMQGVTAATATPVRWGRVAAASLACGETAADGGPATCGATLKPITTARVIAAWLMVVCLTGAPLPSAYSEPCSVPRLVDGHSATGWGARRRWDRLARPTHQTQKTPNSSMASIAVNT